MKLLRFDTDVQAGRAAAHAGATAMRTALDSRGEATIIVATGASQFHVLATLVAEPDLRWDRVTVFHLDEYVGIPVTHPASFRRYLWERFHSKLPLPVRAFHYIDGEADPRSECRRVGELITETSIDVCFCGIGENGHLAFNDPPADFETEEPYIVVELDEACRRQQLGEGWFESIERVPRRAISMSIRQIMTARTIVCTVPDERKADAVRNTVEGEISPDVPASILRRHNHATIYVDAAAASRLGPSA